MDSSGPPRWQSSPYWEALLEKISLEEQLMIERFRPDETYYFDKRERLLVGNSGPSYMISEPFQIAKRHTSPMDRRVPSYIKDQLDEYRCQHWSQPSTNDSAQPDARLGSTIYKPLAQDEIRLLQILPASFESPLRGRLHTVNMKFEFESKECWVTHETPFGLSTINGEPLCYTALSYVWGSTAVDKIIWLGDCSLNITADLDTCIRHLRHETDSVMLWADQVCINQTDVAERTQQVLLMRLIYTRAWNTVIWLGSEPDRGAFGALDILDGNTSLLAEDMPEDMQDHVCSLFRNEPETLQNLSDLFCRAWFTRTWTIQEYVLSKRPYFMAAYSTLSSADFGKCIVLRDMGILDAANRGKVNHRSIVAGLETSVDLWLLKSYLNGHQAPSSLIDVLVQTRYANVTHPVDKVYGVLGLCRHDIVPDYSRSAFDVFRESTVGAMQDELADMQSKHQPGSEMRLGYHGVSKILCCVDHVPVESRQLPSWIPDWSRPRATTSLGYTTHVARFYKAGGPFLDSHIIKLNAADASLSVSGKLVDTIDRVSPIVVDPDLSYDSPAETNISLLYCIDFVRTQPTDIPQAAQYFPFCQTIVAGKDSTGMNECGEQYVEVLSLLCDETSEQRPTFYDQVYSTRQQRGYFTLDHLKKRNPGRLFQGLRKGFRSAMHNRRLCWTRDGRLGLVPRFARDGDKIVLIPGCAVPFVLRHRSSDEHILIGESYVHGVMDGSCIFDAASSLSNFRIV